MTPSISPLSSVTNENCDVPAPPRFRTPVGRIYDVTLSATQYSRPASALTAARIAGLRYEEKVQYELFRYSTYLAAPRLNFSDDRGVRHCIPDGVLVRLDRVVVFEIKSQHMPEAWWQLRRLYQPVLEASQVARPVQVVEVCRSFDIAMPFPEPVTLIGDVEEVFNIPVTSFGVLVWKM